MASPAAEALAKKHNETLSKPGHNSDPQGKLKGYVDRLFNLEEEKQTIGGDIKDLKSEMKDNDVDPKAVARIVKEKMEDADKRAKRLAFEETVDHYKHSLGLLLD